MKKKYLIVLLLFFSFIFPIFSENETVVNIESAQKTEYRKIEEDDVVIFTGNVKLSVTQNDNVIYIEADNVTFNRNRSVIYADGNVVFTESSKIENMSSESLTASSLLFNTKTMEGVFDSARVVQESSDNINLANGTTLIVSSELFGKENSGTVTFKNGVLTFCDDENPHWKIKASRIWLLPGNEFSFLNALLYVGNLPIFYLPFFYYPKDEMIFNPVFGYRPREGYFTQTTTYLVGRKPLQSSKTSTDEDSIPIFDFMKTTELKKQERVGLFLKNLDEKATMPNNSLKIVGDIYSNLGGLVGIDGTFKNLGPISNIAFGTYFGFSNTLFPLTSTVYSKYSQLGKSYYNHSYLFGLELPFRYYINFNVALAKSPYSLNISMPLYSDQWFQNDFLNRSENMDWISYLMDDSKKEEPNSISEVSSFSWTLNGNISSFSFVKYLNPFIQNMSLSLSSSVNFLAKKNTLLIGEDSLDSPERSFFYPSVVYPAKISANISGKILSFSNSGNKSTTSKSNSLNDLTVPITIEGFGAQEDKKNEEVVDNSFFDDSLLPSIKTKAISVKNTDSYSYNLSYGVKPDFSSELNFLSDDFTSPDKIDIKKIKSTFINVKVPGNLTSNLSFKEGFISLNNTFNFNTAYQNHPIINEDYKENNKSAVDNMILSDYNSRKIDIINTNTVKLIPFVFVDELSKINISWNTSLKLLTTSFDGTLDNPKWDYKVGEWSKDFLTKNYLSASFSFSQFGGNVTESITLNANLPPLVDSYSLKFNLKFPTCTNFQLSFGVKEDSKNKDAWVMEPISQSSSWSFFDKKLQVSQNFKYNVEENHFENFYTSVNGLGITASYTMSYTNPYRFSPTDGTWQIEPEKKFLPYELRFSYSMPSTKFTAFAEKISIAPTLSTELRFDLIQITSCYFSISPGFTIKINNFLNLNFSSTSRNDVMFRYVQKWLDVDMELPGETNFFKDLLNSFAFGDKTLRQSSGFKLKQLKVTLSHDLHDWTLNSSFTLAPRLIKTSTPYRYDFSPYFTLSVSWNPMESFKTTIEDKYGDFVLY